MADQTSGSTNKALILFDGAPKRGEGALLASHVANLMGHFGFQAQVKQASDYTSRLADGFPVLFVCGTSDATVLPRALLEDVAQREQSTVWIHLHLDQLTALTNAATKLGLAYLEEDDEADMTTVIYHGVRLPKDYPDLDRIRILDTNKVEVVATAENSDRTETAPYVLRSGKFWYFAAPGFAFEVESDVSLVLADLLHDILGVKHGEERRALARIEDVSPSSDPADLRRVADILSARHVPFQIALIPVYKDPVSHVDLTLSEVPEVVAAVKYMVAHGGTVHMHGVTHQFHGVSGDDYEFWDTVANRPTPDGPLNVLAPKLQRGLEECFLTGLYPLAFETPHYGASMEHYRSLATVFSHCYERRVLCDRDDTVEYCPFVTTDVFGQTIIPENLGYVPEEKPDASAVISAADRLRVVRDPVASFYFHPFMAAKYLEQILDALKRDGYRFASLKDFAPSLVTGDYAVSATQRSVTLTPRQPFLKTTTLGAQGAASEQVQPVEAGKPVTIALNPPAGGLVAVQSIRQAMLSKETPKSGLVERMKAAWRGPDRKGLAATTRAREALFTRESAAFKSALGAYGIPCRALDPNEPLPNDAFVVVPARTVLAPGLEEKLEAWIKRGGRAIIEGRMPLAERLGFQFDGHTFTPIHLQDYLVPETPIHWPDGTKTDRFTPPPVNATLEADDSSGVPVAVAARVAEGMVIFLASELDPETGLGYTRFPFLALHLRQRFGVEPEVTAHGVEFYFDPGFRQNSSAEELVKAWHEEGVRAVYVAAWHFYEKWSYDFDRLIRLCHAEGIAVYAWLEFPEVTPRMWDEHPEWREKTVTGQEPQFGWRRPMNLANAACREAAYKFLDDLLDQHDWDGVNIAEVCFDTEEGMANPAGYTPMNADVRAEFTRQAGFDPTLLFDERSTYYWRANAEAEAKWMRFRTGLTRDWLAGLLEHLSRRQLDVIVTALDSIAVPSVIDKNGCDSRDAVALMERYNFTLQVEDTSEMWGASPTRYATFGEAYRRLVKDPSRLMFDLNVVKERILDKSPTALASGVEFALSARAAASAGNGRVAIYSESTVQLEDRGLLPFVLGAGTPVNTRSNATVIAPSHLVRYRYRPPPAGNPWWAFWRARGSEDQFLPVVNGQPWLFGKRGTLLLPPGQHCFQNAEVPPERQTIRVKDISTPFTNAQATKAGFGLDYDSSRRVWMRLSREPSAVLSDGKTLTNAVTRAGREWLVALPAGRHHAEVQAATTLAVAVEQTGEGALASIVWLGERGLLLLGGLYAATRVRRLWLSLRRKKPAKAAAAMS
jgi:uncharacterized protein YdaL